MLECLCLPNHHQAWEEVWIYGDISFEHKLDGRTDDRKMPCFHLGGNHGRRHDFASPVFSLECNSEQLWPPGRHSHNPRLNNLKVHSKCDL